RGHVSRGNARGAQLAIFGHSVLAVGLSAAGQRRPANRVQVHVELEMLHHVERAGHQTSRFDLWRVTLAIANRQCIQRVSLLLADGRSGVRVQAAAQQNHGWWQYQTPRWSGDQMYL